MKKIFLFPLFFFFFSFACKKTEQQTQPSVLHISGLVTDKQTATPIDSVSVSLNYNTGSIGSPSIPQMEFYTGTDGKFNFQFSPKNNYTYKLGFDKTGVGYKLLTIPIDRDKEYQQFDVSLEK